MVVKFADTQKEKEQKKVLQLQNNLWSLSGTPSTVGGQAPTLAAAAPPPSLISTQYLTVSRAPYVCKQSIGEVPSYLATDGWPDLSLLLQPLYRRYYMAG